MRNIKLTIEYDGTNYCGWQVQPNGITVQEVLKKTIMRVLQEKIVLIGAGRTDSGVHAHAQVASFKTSSTLEPDKMRHSLNSVLPNDIVVTNVEDAPENFNAQKNSKGKHYRYCILNGYVPSALNHGKYWYIKAKLDIKKMKKAAKYLVGEHDFNAFKASDACTKTSVRKITKIKIKKKGDYIIFDIFGTGFLKNMVRTIIGTFFSVGIGKISPKEVKTILESRDRTKAGKTAPACGLFLVEVYY